MQEITQFTKALGQTSGGIDSGSAGSNINTIRLRSGRTIPNATHVPTPYPSERLEREPSESVETDDQATEDWFTTAKQSFCNHPKFIGS